jgi:hypothetical protein
MIVDNNDVITAQPGETLSTRLEVGVDSAICNPICLISRANTSTPAARREGNIATPA